MISVTVPEGGDSFLIHNSREVHIWSAYLPENEKDISYFTSILSEDERQRANNFKFSQGKMNFIIARGILRCLLANYLGLSPGKIDITYGLWGKPYVAYYPLYFNLSHSQHYVFYAITQGYEVGIDIEYIDPTLDVEPLALSILSPQELVYWKGLNLEEKASSFFKLWVCKEAFLKAAGKGWLSSQSTLPREVLEMIRKKKTTRDPFQNVGITWILDSIPGYVWAFFTEGPTLRPVYNTWNSTARSV